MSWIPHIRDSLHRLECSIEITNPPRPVLQRERDQCIMDILVRHPMMPRQRKMINACHLYLGVTLLSNMCTADGTTIRPEILKGVRNPLYRPRHLLPYQDCPDPTAWQLWLRCLTTLTTHPSSPKLWHSLGKWLVTGSSTVMAWPSLYDPSTQQAFLHEDDCFRIYTVCHTCCTPTAFKVSHPPASAVPDDFSFNPICPMLFPFFPARVEVPIPFPLPCFLFFVQQLDPWEHDLLAHHTLSTPTFFHFVSTLSLTSDPDHHLLACSEGSASNFCGTFGWVCSLPSGERLAHCNGPAPSWEFTAHSSPTCPIRIYSDSQRVLSKLATMSQWPSCFPNQTLHPNWDVLQAVVTATRSLPSVVFHHAKDDHDAHTPIASLPLAAQLNIEANALANDFQYGPTMSPIIALLILGSSAALHSRHGTISSHLKAAIRQFTSATPLRQYLQTSNGWDSSLLDSIDWNSHGISLRK